MLVLYSTFVPSFSLQKDYVVTVVAVLGTTITPYCFFWQSSQEAEDERVDPTAHALIDAPEQAPAEISRMRFDTYIGMGYSNVISLFIIVATAATLNANGVTDIQTSAQAAEALRPIAGVFTFALFAAGIIGIGLLAVPVLAASGAYALGEALKTSEVVLDQLDAGRPLWRRWPRGTWVATGANSWGARTGKAVSNHSGNWQGIGDPPA